MCMACGDPLSRPFVSSVTLTVLPLIRRVALPVPVTRFVGTAWAAARNGCPAAFDFADERLDPDPPEPSTMAMAMMPATTTRTTGMTQPRPRRPAAVGRGADEDAATGTGVSMRGFGG